MRQAASGAQGRSEEDDVNTPDLAVIAVTVTGLANTGAILLGLRMVARQLRIAAPPRQQDGKPPAGGTGNGGGS